jgi:hypothetical protein
VEINMDNSNQGLAENCDPGSAEFISQEEIPNEVSRQAIQDAVNGVGMQTVNSIDDLMKAMGV